jgi:hypothetical protein
LVANAPLEEFVSSFPRGSARQGMGTRSGYTAIVGALLIAASASSAHAQQPPWQGCQPVSKIEYDSAKREYLLTSRNGRYIRTGHFMRRYYWWCHV